MLHLIIGGSGSGKSAYAEAQIVEYGGPNRIYIATMYPFDDESHERIRRHRQMRSQKQFSTIERYVDLNSLVIPKGADVLLECMSNLTANEMFQENGAHEKTVEQIVSGVRNLMKQAGNLVIVTNEIFSDGILYDPETVRYQRYLGEINRELAKMADRVTEVVYGIPVPVK